MPPLHANAAPQPPQLFASPCSSTQAPEHAVYPLLQEIPHFPLTHAACPCTGTGHTETQLPQWFGSVPVSMHEPLQFNSPFGQLVPHCVPSQVADPPEGAGQGLQDVPHVAGDMSLTHAPLQACCPDGH
jgi:hypothetical protein